MPISTKILEPHEAAQGTWIAVIEGWHVRAESRSHAQRIIDTCKMVAAAAKKEAKAEIRTALGLRAYGDHAPR
ncbi:hypothetical protein [Phaeobacter piscinae]|uniref:hypothetical protein n=1 Tax=Phaeobacter piscinae TaxID=1580596 RepID=UPI000C9A1429|nr:hypothetical protein [Phaeobacter piscinae]AUQ74733.1 hypothetical protein PhaeoP71_01872 [Phaeobacter piscinae]